MRSVEKRVGKREIARAFSVKGTARSELKKLLREMVEEGLIEGSSQTFRDPNTLPVVGVIEIIEIDEDGELIGQPSTSPDRDDQKTKLRVRIIKARNNRGSAAGKGDYVLARIRSLGVTDETGCTHEARILKFLPRERDPLLGIFVKHDSGGFIDPIDRRHLKQWPVKADDCGDFQSGDLVNFKPYKSGRWGGQLCPYHRAPWHCQR